MHRLLKEDRKFGLNSTTAFNEIVLMSRAPLGIALIGAGRIGQLHATNMVRNPRARLLCVFEQDKERAKLVAEMAGCQVASLFEEAIDFPGVEAVYVCSPTDTH